MQHGPSQSSMAMTSQTHVNDTHVNVTAHSDATALKSLWYINHCAVPHRRKCASDLASVWQQRGDSHTGEVWRPTAQAQTACHRFLLRCHSISCRRRHDVSQARGRPQQKQNCQYGMPKHGQHSCQSTAAIEFACREMLTAAPSACAQHWHKNAVAQIMASGYRVDTCTHMQPTRSTIVLT